MDASFSMDLAQAMFQNNWNSMPPSGPTAEPVHLPQRRLGMNADLQQLLWDNGITQQNKDILEENGFLNVMTFKVLKKEDLADMRIAPLAQLRVLESLLSPVESPAPPQQQAQCSLPPRDPLDEMNRQLRDILGAIPVAGSPATAHPSHQGERFNPNPLAHLAMPQVTKYMKIVDFVRPGREQAEQQVWEENSCSLVLKTGQKKVQLEKVSTMQWSAASQRIMCELVREGKLQPAEMLDYSAYTVMISELALNFTWQSVLQYDDAYRERQAQSGFRWGSDPPHLDKLLRVRDFPQQQQQKQGTRHQSPDQKDIFCRLFQKDNCPYGHTCKFAHVCAAPNCRKSHPLSQHQEVVSKDNQTVDLNSHRRDY